MGGRTLNVAYAEPKQNEQQAQQQSQAQPKVRITPVLSGSHYTSQNPAGMAMPYRLNPVGTTS